MKYRPIERKDGTVYMLGIPDSPTEPPITTLGEIVVELLDEIDELVKQLDVYDECLKGEEKW